MAENVNESGRIADRLVPVKKWPQIRKFMDDQMKIFWLPTEVKVEKDIQDVLVNFTEAERHGVITVLKLFTIYEAFAGECYWGGRFKTFFEDYEFQQMASAFSFFENCVHHPLYDKINTLLHIDNEEFYLSYLDNPTLTDRIKHIDAIIEDPDQAVSLAGFAFVEGVVLYSSFAFLMHFQAEGKNKLLNLNRGIAFSVRDENMHCLASAYCYRLKTKDATQDEKDSHERIIREVAAKVLEHETEIVRMVFEKGPIEGITAETFIEFIKSRINEVMKLLGFKEIYKIGKNPIADWFYKMINNYAFGDIFAGALSEYHRDWDETAFVWKTADELNEEWDV